MIEKTVFVILLAWFVTHFEPIQYLLTKLHHRKHIIDLVYMGIRKLFSCQYCLSFWLGLIVLWSLPYALLASFIAFWLIKIEMSI